LPLLDQRHPDHHRRLAVRARGRRPTRTVRTVSNLEPGN
jgi:hypothetical protein